MPSGPDKPFPVLRVAEASGGIPLRFLRIHFKAVIWLLMENFHLLGYSAVYFAYEPL
jgi:hypothetical protein